MSEEQSFEQMLNESFKTIRNGEVVEGTGLDVKPDVAYLNIGYKSDGILTKEEYSNENTDLTTKLAPGDKLEVKVLKVNDGEGQVILTYKRLAQEKGNKRIEEAFNNGEVLLAKVSQVLSFYEDFFEDFDRTRAEALLNQLSIDPSLRLKQLSKGNREKVQLIVTMSRNAKVFFLDEPIAGVDPAARDYILKTILASYNQDALILISTHLIADVENILDEAVFLKQGQIFLHKSTDEIRQETGKSVDEYFREVYAC